MNRNLIFKLLAISLCCLGIIMMLSTFYSITHAQDTKEPSVSITADITTGTAPLAVSFTSTVNDPFEGKYPITYDWHFDDGAASTKQNPQHTFTAAGTYNVICRITFWKSPKVTVEASVEIKVSGAQPLAVSISAAPTSGKAPLTVNFISTVIGRISGEKVAYKWDFGDETTSEEANPTHTFNSAGTYTVTCTVTGGTPSQTAGDTIEINVAPTWPAAVCTADGDQSSPQIATDGSGGAIIGWQDQRSGNNWDIYAGRISSTGELLWTADGVAICTEEHQQEYLQITIDGSGGAIITWMDKRSGDYWDIYIQRIDSTGKPIWATDGVAVCTAAYNQESPRITTDGSGGAIITWQDYRKGNRDIYTQRIDSTGKPVWTTDGVAISTAYSHQSNPQIISDGSGGAIITWQDYRSDIEDIYAARISSTGELPWTADGVPICIAAGFQVNPQITTDGSGGAIITWQDQRSGNHDIYARRIAGNGGLMWTSDGVPICTAANDQRYPQIAPDGSGGAIFTWQDARVNQYGDIYAQRMDSTGKPLWTANGVPICTQSGAKQPPRITYNGSGGSFITWPDSRGSGWVIYAQLVSDDGKVQWMENGAALTGNNVSYHTLQIISDGSDGAIIVWGEYSDKENYDIYARRISKEVKVK